MTTASIGIIGGSGLYMMPGMKVLEERQVTTPFGDPPDALVIGELEGRCVVFLPRHGTGHRHSPSTINYRANIYALKSLGVECIIAVSAVGSLREDIHPGHLVIVDQFIDRTRGRPSTFFDLDVVAHISFADPICPHTAQVLNAACKEADVPSHFRGTYVCMEGPAFSTRAESNWYRAMGASVIGMTNLQEAKLAREAEICLATLALSTDYDCWKEDEVVDVAKVMATMKQNIENAQKVIRLAVPKLTQRPCQCGSALKGAIMTDPKAIPAAARERLGIFINKYTPSCQT
jgi:5'-methylthioadenosine phosphorylase